MPGVDPGVTSDAANIPSGGPQPGQDSWPGAANPSAILTGHTGGAGRGSAQAAPTRTYQPRDYAAAFRSMGYVGGNEGPGSVQARTSQGPAPHGTDIPGEGVPGPAGDLGGLGDAGGAAAGEAGLGELAELAPLALA